MSPTCGDGIGRRWTVPRAKRLTGGWGRGAAACHREYQLARAAGADCTAPALGYGTSVAVSYLDLPTPIAIAVALFVATIKGSLVACYFMHLISEKKLVYAVLVITVVMFAVLLALPAFTHSDVYGLYE